ncbi:uncharacterized protein LOC144073023 [Stigmatopora argus]
MSVTFDSKLGALRGDGWELMDSKSEYGGRFPKSVWWIGAVALCLGLLYLLLLVVILAMVSQYVGPSPMKPMEQLSTGLPSCQNLTSQCLQIQGRYNTLLESKNQLDTKLCSLTKAKDTAEGERDRLQNDRDMLQNQRDILEKERNALHSERDNLKNERDVLHNERDALKNEKGTIIAELDNLQNETGLLRNERDNLQVGQRAFEIEEEKLKSERDTLKNEKEALQHERDNVQNEHEVLKGERDTLKNEKDTLQNEQEALKNERDSLKNEKDTLLKNQEVLKHERDTIKNDKDTLQKERDSLRKERDTLTGERDHLKSQSSNLTKELEVLQTRFNTVVASRDGFKEEAEELNHNRTEKLCPSGWNKFGEKCYYISEKGETKTWKRSRGDCQDRGGDLVIVTTKEERNFISTYYDRIWIGLSDIEHEGKWKWVNGEELNFGGFWQKGEPNDSDAYENCVEQSRSGKGWNDMPCSETLSWVCED